MKEQRYFVDFEFKLKVTGYVMATSAKEAKRKVKECSNPEFDEMLEHSNPSEPDIEFETVTLDPEDE